MFKVLRKVMDKFSSLHNANTKELLLNPVDAVKLAEELEPEKEETLDTQELERQAYWSNILMEKSYAKHGLNSQTQEYAKKVIEAELKIQCVRNKEGAKT